MIIASYQSLQNAIAWHRKCYFIDEEKAMATIKKQNAFLGIRKEE
jgi:hypothetical protein